MCVWLLCFHLQSQQQAVCFFVNAISKTLKYILIRKSKLRDRRNPWKQHALVTFYECESWVVCCCKFKGCKMKSWKDSSYSCWRGRFTHTPAIKSHNIPDFGDSHPVLCCPEMSSCKSFNVQAHAHLKSLKKDTWLEEMRDTPKLKSAFWVVLSDWNNWDGSHAV